MGRWSTKLHAVYRGNTRRETAFNTRRWNTLLANSEKRLRELNVDSSAPFDLRSFTDSVQRMRGRPIFVQSFRKGPGSAPRCGFLIIGDDYDAIFYPQTGNRRLELHTILHEIAHLLLDHEGIELDLTRADFVGINAQISATAEAEAEALASLILAGASLHRSSGDVPCAA